MAVPFRRTSKTRKRLRRSHQNLTIGALVTCPNCASAVKPHHVCGVCGYYDGKIVNHVVKTAKAEEKPAKAEKVKKAK